MARLIKRYENRKLYDTEASAYVSLSDIAELVRDGETVKVVDQSTGQDLTAQTLTQIILAEGKEGHSPISPEVLHKLLRRSGAALDAGLDQLRVRVDDLVQHSMDRLGRLLNGPRADELDALRHQLHEAEQKLGTLLNAIESPEEEHETAEEESTGEESVDKKEESVSAETGEQAPRSAN
jgi:polyhydroxyalkanoate synthesis repressor PhaR